MRRRDFIASIGGTAASALAANAEQVPVVGFFNTGAPEEAESIVAAFRKGLSETGFEDGRNLSIDFRWARFQPDRYSEILADFIRRKVDVIATPGSVAGALAAKAATSTIPIVFSTSGDPVQLGLVASLNRPGGNVTGFDDMSSELAPKMLGFLHELLPRAVRFGVFSRRSSPWIEAVIKDATSAASALSLEVEFLFAANARDVDAAFESIVNKRIDGFVLPSDLFLFGRQTQILTLAARHAVPAVYHSSAWVKAGGLMSYGPFPNEQQRQAGIYVGRILKGEKPADLPVGRTSKFDFAINLATARAIGLTVPPTLLAQAETVIE